MRLLPLAAALLLPAALAAQFPAPGRYDITAVQAGAENRFQLFLEVATQGDSTVLTFGQSAEQTIPIDEQGTIADGFYIRFFNSRCPFVKLGDHWEAVCANTWDVPQFVMTLRRKADSAPS